MGQIEFGALLILLAIGPTAANAGCVSCISTAFLQPLAEKNPRLAGAIWGALVENATASPQEIGPSRLDTGDYSGTMRSKGHPYTYLTRVQAQTDGFRLSVTIRREDGTGKVEEFEGSLSNDGRRGDLARVVGKARSVEFRWNTPDS